MDEIRLDPGEKFYSKFKVFTLILFEVLKKTAKENPKAAVFVVRI